MAVWGHLCDFVNEARMKRNDDYIKAVEGCLYLHITLQKPHRGERWNHFGEILRKAIYEEVVKYLELVVNPPNSKRKSSDSVSEFFPPKKQSLIQSSSPSDTIPQGWNLHDHISPSPNVIRPHSRDDFELVIVCALPLEYGAVSLLFDEFWDEDCDTYGRADGDPNIYTTGRIGNVNIVLVPLSSMGKVSAASTSASLRSSYSKLKLVLASGICGGVPFPCTNEELILGDVVTSRCVVQYDLGKKHPEEFMMKDTVENVLGRAPRSIRNLLTLLETDCAR